MNLVLKIEESKSVLLNYGFDHFESIFSTYKTAAQSNFEIRAVMKFVRACYEARVLIEFDWINWKEGFEALDSQNFENKGLQFLCMILTVIIRKDRIVENYLLHEMKRGTIEKLLNQIKVHYGK